MAPSPRFDATNLASYPWVQTSIKEFCFLWLLPTLWITSRGFHDALKSANLFKDWKIARRVKSCANRWKLVFEGSLLKTALLKHIYVLWPHTTASTITDTLNSICCYFATVSHPPKVNPYLAKVVGLSGESGLILLKFLIRLACWMVFFGLKDTCLFMVFMSRMDMYISEAAKHYPFTRKKKISFSKAIEWLSKEKQMFPLWVWNMQTVPVHVHDPIWLLYQVRHKDILMCLQTMPKSIQLSVMFLGCYKSMHASKCQNVSGRVQKKVSGFLEYVRNDHPIRL